jgi:hypothetical protein
MPISLWRGFHRSTCYMIFLSRLTLVAIATNTIGLNMHKRIKFGPRHIQGRIDVAMFLLQIITCYFALRVLGKSALFTLLIGMASHVCYAIPL